MFHYLLSFFSFRFEDSYYGEPKSTVPLLPQFCLVLQCKPAFVVKGFPDISQKFFMAGCDLGNCISGPSREGNTKKGNETEKPLHVTG